MQLRSRVSWILWILVLALALPQWSVSAQDIEPEEEDEDDVTAIPVQQGGGVAYAPFVVGAVALGAGAGYVITQEKDEGDSPLERARGTTPTMEEPTGGGGNRVDTSVIVYILSGRYESAGGTSCNLPPSISFVSSSSGATLSGGSSAVTTGVAPIEDPGCACSGVQKGGAQVNVSNSRVSISGVGCEDDGESFPSDYYNRPNWSFKQNDYIDIGNNTRVIKTLVHPDGATFRLASP